MALTLTVLRCPDRVAPETRRLQGGELIIGRGPGAGWSLTDAAERPQISRRHCTVFYSGGAWKITDQSTNGTFLGSNPDPIGTGERTLQNGDRIRVGAYEIEAGIDDREIQVAPQDISFDPFAGSHAGVADPFAPSTPLAQSPFGGPASVRLPDDFASELFDPAPLMPQPSQIDHTPAFSDAMQMPQPRGVLPSDWDAPHASIPVQSQPQASIPVAPQPAAFMPADWDSPEPLAPAAPPTAPPPAAQPIAAPPPALAPAFMPEAMPEPIPASAPIMAATPTPPPTLAPTSAAIPDTGLLEAFLRGAGVQAAAVADPTKTMEQAGRAFRAFVGGLREVLIARAEVKSAFRIDQTMVRARGNNPLKFSAGDDDALAALLGTGRHTEMSPATAVTEALRDIRIHELASMAAMQDAVRELLEKLDPTKIRASAEAGGIALGVQRRARAFEIYETEFAKLHESLSERFDDVFGRAFARAYEQVVAELQAKGNER